jgi:hypothetical protein
MSMHSFHIVECNLMNLRRIPTLFVHQEIISFTPSTHLWCWSQITIQIICFFALLVVLAVKYPLGIWIILDCLLLL